MTVSWTIHTQLPWFWTLQGAHFINWDGWSTSEVGNDSIQTTLVYRGMVPDTSGPPNSAMGQIAQDSVPSVTCPSTSPHTSPVESAARVAHISPGFDKQIVCTHAQYIIHQMSGPLRRHHSTISSQNASQLVDNVVEDLRLQSYTCL